MSTQTQIALRPARNPENRTASTRASREKPRRKREASPEQKEAAAARRAEIRAMFAKISALPEEKRILLASRLGIRSAEEGREFSICNQLLIAAQCRHASIVGGFDQWRQSGRAVSKGQRAIAIWVPCRRGESADGTAAPIAPEALTPAAGGGEKSSPFFILGNVFDISQTYDIATGEPHPLQALNAPARGPLLLPWTDDTPAPEPAAVVDLATLAAEYQSGLRRHYQNHPPAGTCLETAIQYAVQDWLNEVRAWSIPAIAEDLKYWQEKWSAAADAPAVVELYNGPADYLSDTGESWQDATPEERAAYLAQSAALPDPPAEIILPEPEPQPAAEIILPEPEPEPAAEIPLPPETEEPFSLC